MRTVDTQNKIQIILEINILIEITINLQKLFFELQNIYKENVCHIRVWLQRKINEF